jgi:hypothetical protein
MKPILTATLLLIILTTIPAAQAQQSCTSFQALVKATYTFKPSQLSEAQRDTKVVAMDKVWNAAKANPRELVPCLRTMLESTDSDPWFRFDGSNLLVSLDPSPESKAIQVRHFTNTDLGDVHLAIWIQTLARRGSEGFDVSEAANRWLTYPKARYFLPRHGAFEVQTFHGALFLFGSMDESQATPALLKIVNQASHPARETALLILMDQATPESLRSLKQIDTQGFSYKTRQSLRTLLSKPQLFTPRAQPKTSRAEFLEAFNELLIGRGEKFIRLITEVPDGEVDVVAVLKPEDLPLVRKVRRRMVANATPHAVEFYDSFTKILMTLIWKPEFVNGAIAHRN